MVSTVEIGKRNAEIMKVVAMYRHKCRLSMRRCAQELSVGQKRYRLMELGERPIGAAELEVLMRFLNIPRDALEGAQAADDDVHEVVCRVPLGQRLNVVIIPEG